MLLDEDGGELDGVVEPDDDRLELVVAEGAARVEVLPQLPGVVLRDLGLVGHRLAAEHV